MLEFLEAVIKEDMVLELFQWRYRCTDYNENSFIMVEMQAVFFVL
jgi:hypothetical protein